MCQTRAISNRIVNLGTRTYRQRLRAFNHPHTPTSSLHRLAEDLETFHTTLRSQWDSITEDDYHTFGPQLTIVLDTLCQLINAYKQTERTLAHNIDVSRLEQVYSDLTELNQDIRQFKIRLPKDAELNELMSRAATALNRLAI